MKKRLFIGSLMLSACCVHAQQIPLSSQYYFNPMTYNPALTGISAETNVFLTHHSQWKTIPGAPVTTSLTVDGPMKKKKVGLGGSIYNSRSDLIESFGVNAFYSNLFDFSEQSHLHFGLTLGVADHRVDFSKAVVKDLDDPFLLEGIQKRTVLDAGAGIAYRIKQTEMGFSAQNLTGGSVEYFSNDSRSAYHLSRSYALSAKQLFFLNKEKNISACPFLLYRFASGAPSQYDINLVANFRDVVSLGASYRSNYCVSASIRVKAYGSLSVGYSHDFISSAIGTYAGVSNEFVLGYSFHSGSQKADEAIQKKYEEEIAQLNKRLQTLEDRLSKNEGNENEKLKEEVKALVSQMEQLRKETKDGSEALKTKILLLEERVNTLMKLIGS